MFREDLRLAAHSNSVGNSKPQHVLFHDVTSMMMAIRLV